MADRVVVMDLGRVQQAGSPRRSTETRRTASWRSSSARTTIFSGRIAGVEGQRITVETPTGAFTVQTQDGIQPVTGERGELRDRRRPHLDCVRGGELAENQVEGKLTGKEFVGAVATLFLELPDGSEFKVQKQEHQIALVSAELGESFVVSWEPEAAFLLPNP